MEILIKLIVPNRFDLVGGYLRSETLKKARYDYYYQQVNKEQLTMIDNKAIMSLSIEKQLFDACFLEYATNRAGGFKPLSVFQKTNLSYGI